MKPSADVSTHVRKSWGNEKTFCSVKYFQKSRVRGDEKDPNEKFRERRESANDDGH